MGLSANTTEIPISLLNSLQDVNHDVRIELQHLGRKVAISPGEDLMRLWKHDKHGVKQNSVEDIDPRELQRWGNSHIAGVIAKYDWDHANLVSILEKHGAATKAGIERWENTKLAGKLAAYDMNVHMLLALLPGERSYMELGREPKEEKLNALAAMFLIRGKAGHGEDEDDRDAEEGHKIDDTEWWERMKSVVPTHKEDGLVVVAREMLEKWERVVEVAKKQRKDREG